MKLDLYARIDGMPTPVECFVNVDGQPQPVDLYVNGEAQTTAPAA